MHLTAIEQLEKYLQPPLQSRVHQRLTKAFFYRNYPQLLPAERRLLEDPLLVQQMDIMAVLRPDTTGLPVVETETECYEDLLYLAVKTDRNSKLTRLRRLTGLLHNGIAYPVWLVFYCEDENQALVAWKCSAAPFRKAGAGAINSYILLEEHITEWLYPDRLTEPQQAFLNSLAYHEINAKDLKDLYLKLCARIVALQIADKTGLFRINPYHKTRQVLEVISQIEELEKQITRLTKESYEAPIAARTEIFRQIQVRRTSIAQLSAGLGAE